MLVKYLLPLLSIIIFTSCEDGSSSSTGDKTTTTATTQTRISYLYDSKVNGINYKCGDDITGITGYNKDNTFRNDGSFRYFEDCGQVIFTLGKVYIGELSSKTLKEKEIIFPTALIYDNNITISESIIKNTKVKNILRFLQSIDDNNDPSDGILISKENREKFSLSSTNSRNIQEDSIADINTTLNQVLNKNITNEDIALEHFENTIQQHINPHFNVIPPAKPKLVNEAYNTTKKTFTFKGEKNSHIYIKNDYLNDTNFSKLSFKINNENLFEIEKTLKNVTEAQYFTIYIQDENNPALKSNELKVLLAYDNTAPSLASIKNISLKEDENLTAYSEIKADNEKTVFFKILSASEDNRSIHADKFLLIDDNISDNAGKFDFNRSNSYFTNGIVDFETLKQEGKITKFQLVIDVVDDSKVKNHSSLLVTIDLSNILDNPPGLSAPKYNTNLTEEFKAINFYDFNTSLKTKNDYPDNDILLSPVVFSLKNFTSIFTINSASGQISVNDENNSLLDFEYRKNNSLSETLDLNVCVENNNTLTPTNANLNLATYKDLNTSCSILHINLINKIDTSPSFNPLTQTTYNYKEIIKNIEIPIELNTTSSDKNLSMVFSIATGNTNNDLILDISTNTHPNSSFKLTDKDISPTKNNLDYETTTEYNLTIKATNTWYDGTKHDDNISLRIIVDNIIDNPPLIKDINDTSFEENASIGSFIGTIKSNGTTIDEQNITSYEIVKISRAGITMPNTMIKLTDNNISTNTELNGTYYIEGSSNDAKSIYKVNIRACNTNEATSATQCGNTVAFDFNVTNVIDNTPILSVQTSSILKDENTTYTNAIFMVTTNSTIFDENNVSKYNIIQETHGYTSKFDINQSSGAIKINGVLNFEDTLDDNNKTDGIKSYLLKVNATNIWYDGTEHNSSTIDIKIDVNNTIEDKPKIKIYSFPSGTYTNTISIPEALTKGEVIGAIEIDPSATVDQSEISNITLSNSADANFSLSFVDDPRNNLNYKGDKFKVAYIVLENTNLDYETNSSYTLEANITNAFDTNGTLYDFNISIEDTFEKNIPVLVVLADTNDSNITSTDSAFENLFFEPTTKSISNYFKKVFKDTSNIKQALETYGTTNDGIIKVTTNQNHPTDSGTALKNLIQSSLSIVSNDINFTSYDTNTNNIIDDNELHIVFVLPTKNNKSITNTYKQDINVTVDNVQITQYIAINEKINTKLTTIGIPTKFLVQAIYKFNNKIYTDTELRNDSKFDLLGSGYKGYIQGEQEGETPVNLMAYWKIEAKLAIAKVLKKHDIYGNTFNLERKSALEDYTIKRSGDNYNNILKLLTNNANEYYLLENRNIDGNYDDGLKFGNANIPTNNEGLILWKINTTEPSIINTTISNDLTNYPDKVLLKGNENSDLSSDNEVPNFEMNTGSILTTNDNSYKIKTEVKR
jgi:hypothetical protein